MVNPPAGNRTAPVWQPVRGPFARWPRVADTLLAFAAFLLSKMSWYAANHQTAAEGEMAYPPAAAVLIFLVSSAALIRRRSAPVAVHWLVLSASVLAMVLGHTDGPVFAMAFSLYSLGRYAGDDRHSYIGVGASLMLLAIGDFVLADGGGGDIVAMLIAFGIWYAGRRVRFRGEYLRLLEERAEQLERQRAADAERAVIEERSRIARELHDIVAHQVSLMTVQAGAAKTVAEKDPLAAAQAMQAVERAGRQALDELRHLMGVLRPENSAGELDPQPGRADLPALIRDLRNAGLETSLTIEGAEMELPARVDLAVFRIVQEALTNVLKHAGAGARATVQISTRPQGVTIRVTDDGQGGSRLPGSGHGIDGMRERAHLLGGSLRAGAGPEGGFQVVAQLPVDGEQR